jgi:hypothetical protein
VTAIAGQRIDDGSQHGHITQEGASFADARIRPDGWIKPETDLELVLTLLERAQSAPEQPASLARTRVSRAVLSTHGAIGEDPHRSPGPTA